MRNSILLWLVSAIVSVGAHAGTLAALSQISLPRLEDQRNTELLVTSTAFDDLFQTEVTSTASASLASSTSEAEIPETEKAASESLAAAAGETVAALEGGDVKAAESTSLAAENSDTADPLSNQAETGVVNDAAETGAVDSGNAQSPAESTPLTADAAAPVVDAAANASEAAPTVPSPDSENVVAPEALTPQASSGTTAVPSGEQGIAPGSSAIVESGESGVLAPGQGSSLVAETPETLESSAPVSSEQQPLPATPGATVVAAVPRAATAGTPVSSGATVTAVAGGSGASTTARPSGGQEVGALSAGTTVAARGQEASPVTSGEALAPIEAAPPAADQQPGQTASATTIAGPALSQAERIGQFLKSKGDTPCLYAKPGNLNAGRPTFTGYGGGKDMISEFASEFQKAVGVDPRVAMRPVMEAQCPAVDFIRNLRATSPKELAVIIDNQQIADYGNLVGHLDGELGEHVLLLLVDDDGAVQDISSKLLRKGDKNLFAERAILLGPGSKSRYQMLLALSSNEPFRVSASHVAGEALAVFDALARQARGRQDEIALGIASFKIE